MLKVKRTTQFEKDLFKVGSRGCNLDRLQEVIIALMNEQKLPARNRDHKLKGNFKDRRECHIAPDWLLVYKIESDTLILERTGSHSDLF
jgi:mRNA interferase YafQ